VSCTPHPVRGIEHFHRGIRIPQTERRNEPAHFFRFEQRYDLLLLGFGQWPEALSQRNRGGRIDDALLCEMLPLPLQRIAHRRPHRFGLLGPPDLGVRFLREGLIVSFRHLLQHLNRCYSGQIREEVGGILDYLQALFAFAAEIGKTASFANAFGLPPESSVDNAKKEKGSG
jgi:hypothetical protein